MQINTHSLADRTLLGTPLEVETGKAAVVRLVATENMVVDQKGLVHGGFTFGLADYAAMLAVNHPHVVLGSAEARFLAPVRRGDVMVARARVVGVEGRRRMVEAGVWVGEKQVLEARFKCYVLDKHVLDDG